MTEVREGDAALLDQRARALARPIHSDDAAERGSDYLVFTLDEQRYALELRFVQEVALATELLYVPHAPSFLGITTLRGQFIAVVDFLGWLGAKPAPRPERRYVVACGEERADLAILVDELVGLRTLELAQTPTRDPAHQILLEDGLCVLNARALLADPRHFVDASREAPSHHD